MFLVICMQRTMVMVIYQSEQGNSFRTGTENDKVERLESQGDEIIIFFFFFQKTKFLRILYLFDLG